MIGSALSKNLMDLRDLHTDDPLPDDDKFEDNPHRTLEALTNHLNINGVHPDNLNYGDIVLGIPWDVKRLTFDFGRAGEFGIVGFYNGRWSGDIWDLE